MKNKGAADRRPTIKRRPTTYSTAYPSARALSRTRVSRVTMVTSCGGSPSSSAVARCAASSVRIGSTGKGRPTRASTVSVTATRKQRRAKIRSPRTAARSCAGARRLLVRARTIARAASASVNADVTCRPSACSAFKAAASFSRSAASRALDSMHRMSVAVVSAGWAGAVGGRAARAGRRLRFATVAIDQVGGGSPREPDVGPLFERVTGLRISARRKRDICSTTGHFKGRSPLGATILVSSLILFVRDRRARDPIREST